jgi:hypothetical protein
LMFVMVWSIAATLLCTAKGQTFWCIVKLM